MRFRDRLSKWLLGFGDAQRSLTRVQRAKYSASVQHLMGKDRRTWVLALVPGAVAFGTFLAMQRLRPTFATWSWPVVMTGMLCLSIPYVIWVERWKHRRYGPRALRELGLANICPHCAYDLSGCPDRDGRCPECGKAFTRFLPDENWQHMDI